MYFVKRRSYRSGVGPKSDPFGLGEGYDDGGRNRGDAVTGRGLQGATRSWKGQGRVFS